MLPTFVIGLREGLEASLIVSIVAAFLRQRGRSDLLRWVLAGISAAVLLCVGVGVALEVLSRDLPQKQQEGLETVIGAIAVAMVTYMVVWMRRHSRDLKRQLEGATELALAAGSGTALVLMAFLAVLREGFETVVFLLAAFNESNSGGSSAAGAVIGIVAAILLGYALYRGGMKLNLAKFFRATGVVLVLVAAGLVSNAFHTAHEAGWVNFGQQQVLDLSAVVAPGSVQASLITGMLGIQQKPTLIETISWLVYLIPLVVYVAWPPGRRLARRVATPLIGGLAAASVATAIVLTVLIPSAAVSARPLTSTGGSVRLTGLAADQATVSLPLPTGAVTTDGTPTNAMATRTVTARRTGSDTLARLSVTVYTVTVTDPTTKPVELTLAQIAARSGGRLPLGLTAASVGSTKTLPVQQSARTAVTISVEPRTRRVVDAHWTRSVSAVVSLQGRVFPLAAATPVDGGAAPADTTAAVGSAAAVLDRLDRRSALTAASIALWIVGGIALVGWLILLAAGRRARPVTQVDEPAVRTPSNVG